MAACLQIDGFVLPCRYEFWTEKIDGSLMDRMVSGLSEEDRIGDLHACADRTGQPRAAGAPMGPMWVQVGG
jgi:hypothetical protein